MFASVAVVCAETDLTGQVQNQLNAGGQTSGLQQRSTDPHYVITAVIQVVLGLVATVFIFLTVLGGYYYATSHGDEEKSKKGMQLIEEAIIGLGIILAAYSITYFVGLYTGRAVNETNFQPSQNGGGYDLQAGTHDIRDVGKNAQQIWSDWSNWGE